MKRLLAAVFAGLVLMATLAPGVQAMPTELEYPPQLCVCLPPADMM